MGYEYMDQQIWKIQKELMKRHGVDQSIRDMRPLEWYIKTGRASLNFLGNLFSTKPYLIARDLHKGGSDEEIIDRICKRINYERR